MDSSRFVVALRQVMSLGRILLLVGVLVGGAGCSGEIRSSPPTQTSDNRADAAPSSCDVPTSRSADCETSTGTNGEEPVDGNLSDETPAAKSPDADASSTSAPAATSPARSGVDLVYFHTAQACGCMAEMGDVIKAAVHENFPEAITDKTVRFHSIVSDDPANAYFVRMYGSQEFDLFIVTYEGGDARATQVYEIWSLMGDNEAVTLAVTARVADGLALSAQPD